MTAARLGPALDALPPISLDELIERASLQTRFDRKYVLPVDTVGALLEQLPAGTRVLEIGESRSFSYRSLYFDTPDLVSYLLAAQRRRRRFKIRTRVYEESAECWLEVKTQGGRGDTVKERLPYELDDHATLGPGREFVDTTLSTHRITGSHAFHFVPVLTTRYQRTTLHLPDTDSRVTIDTGLVWADGEREIRLSDTAVVETKTGSTASGFDRLLWSNHWRPARISKFATGLAALRPELPSAPWRRTLRRNFPPDSGRPAPADRTADREPGPGGERGGPAGRTAEPDRERRRGLDRDPDRSRERQEAQNCLDAVMTS
ncbi:MULTISPECIES: polyphosphate polymerase domain-containing protein [unclassified Streptomyces]|uniref:polyphosphate polymerase domain-containing protein n=1 Tax=unclassified Streptomyces TaxID=2593676 RepID=UPI000BF6C1C3|nr:polyphosphate polymerase domain-containing protein [Streptomyces sp. Ru87]PGH48317.1 molecular chaperone [Streptomyces sp. Ru87]